MSSVSKLPKQQAQKNPCAFRVQEIRLCRNVHRVRWVASIHNKFKRASQACRHSGGLKDAARALLAEQPSPGSDATWERLKAKFPEYDPAAVEQAVTDAKVAPTQKTEALQDGDSNTSSTRKCSTTSSRAEALTDGAGNDGQRFSHLKSIVNTEIGREEFTEALSSLWRKLVNAPNTFPPEFWTLWKQSSRIALGEKNRPVCIEMTWRRLIAAGIVREWKPKLEEVLREADQFGVAVAGGVERVAMEAQIIHQTGH